MYMRIICDIKLKKCIRLRANCSPKTVKKTIRSGYVALFVYITDMYRKRSVEIKYVIGVLRNKNMVVNAFPGGVSVEGVHKKPTFLFSRIPG